MMAGMKDNARYKSQSSGTQRFAMNVIRKAVLLACRDPESDASGDVYPDRYNGFDNWGGHPVDNYWISASS